MWKMPSSESSSGNMAEPSRDAASGWWFWERLWKSEPVGGLFMAPSRGPGVVWPVESGSQILGDKRMKVHSDNGDNWALNMP